MIKPVTGKAKAVAAAALAALALAGPARAEDFVASAHAVAIFARTLFTPRASVAATSPKPHARDPLLDLTSRSNLAAWPGGRR